MFLGEIISLIVAVSWTATALFAEVATKRAGQLTVNVIRMALSLIFLGTTLWVVTGQPVPTYTDGQTWLWLSLSGFVGYVLGDYCLFNSYILIGSRYGQLFMTLASPFAALAAWTLLGETLSWLSMLGMVICMTGIGMSVLSRTAPKKEGQQQDDGESNKTVSPLSAKQGKKSLSLKLPIRGILLGIGAGAGQGIGLVLSKVGMTHYEALVPATDTSAANMIPFAATMMRAITGLICFTLVMACTRQFHKVPLMLKDGKAMMAGLGAVILGPFIGVSLSLMAVQMAPAGIAQTLMSLTPILILVPSHFLFHAKITWKDVLGAIIAVAGVCLFFI